MSNSNGFSCENQPTSIGLHCEIILGFTYKNPAPGPPHNHLTQEPITNDAFQVSKFIGKIPTDCATSTTDKILFLLRYSCNIAYRHLHTCVGLHLSDDYPLYIICHGVIPNVRIGLVYIFRNKF
jgi:hypothetical protein